MNDFKRQVGRGCKRPPLVKRLGETVTVNAATIHRPLSQRLSPAVALAERNRLIAAGLIIPVAAQQQAIADTKADDERDDER